MRQRRGFGIPKISRNFAENKTKIKANMKLRIYIDAAVVDGFFDEEFSAAAQALFERLKRGVE
jgi:hypothetical protein